MPRRDDRYLRIAAVHWVDANGSKPPKADSLIEFPG
jgi:hypothetical protein